MHTDDKKNIIHGLVRSEKGWISIEEKLRTEEQRRKKIEAGLVFFQGEWIAIEEKIVRVSLPKAVSQTQQPVMVNKTVNKQTYNVYNDNRTMQENIHEHRHVHIDSARLNEAQREELDDRRGKEIPFDKKKQIGRRGPPAGEIMTPS